MSNRYRTRVKGYYCTYCGTNATAHDHFPPASITDYGLILPACGQCNSFAGNLYPYDFTQRLAHVRSRIHRRYKRLLAMPPWTPDELTELGPNLERMVTLWQDRKRIVHQRLVWSVDEYFNAIVPSTSSAQRAAVGAFITVNWLP